MDRDIRPAQPRNAAQIAERFLVHKASIPNQVTEKGAAQCRPSLTERKHRMEKDYIVTIKGTLEQTFHIKTDSLDDAERQANELFTMCKRRPRDTYKQETVSAAWSDWAGHDG